MRCPRKNFRTCNPYLSGDLIPLPMLQQLDNWQRLWMMREACITEEYLSSYIPCRAWNLASPVRLPYAVPLSETGLARPPQSWQHPTEEQAALLR